MNWYKKANINFISEKIKEQLSSPAYLAQSKPEVGKYYMLALEGYSNQVISFMESWSKEVIYDELSFYKLNKDVNQIIVERLGHGGKSWTKTENGEWIEKEQLS